MSSVFQFNSKQLPTFEQAGGKALALIEMTRAGMPVPPGFVLTVDFFTPWLDALKRAPHLSTLETASAHEPGQTARAIQTLCSELEFTESQKAELGSALKKLGNGLFAVRSSSPEEDLEGASFAGGYETTLGATPENIEVAIRHSPMNYS